MLMGFSWDVHGMFIGISWDLHGVFMGCSWDVVGFKQQTIGDFPWDKNGITRDMTYPVGRERVGAMVVDIQDIRSDRKKLNQFPNHIVVIYSCGNPQKEDK
jgi:hypothetical protein